MLELTFSDDKFKERPDEKWNREWCPLWRPHPGKLQSVKRPEGPPKAKGSLFNKGIKHMKESELTQM